MTGTGIAVGFLLVWIDAGLETNSVIWIVCLAALIVLIPAVTLQRFDWLHLVSTVAGFFIVAALLYFAHEARPSRGEGLQAVGAFVSLVVCLMFYFGCMIVSIIANQIWTAVVNHRKSRTLKSEIQNQKSNIECTTNTPTH